MYSRKWSRKLIAGPILMVILTGFVKIEPFFHSQAHCSKNNVLTVVRNILTNQMGVQMDRLHSDVQM